MDSFQKINYSGRIFDEDVKKNYKIGYELEDRYPLSINKALNIRSGEELIIHQVYLEEIGNKNKKKNELSGIKILKSLSHINIVEMIEYNLDKNKKILSIIFENYKGYN